MLEKYIDTYGFVVNPKARHCEGSCDFLVKTANVVPESVQFFENLKPKPDHIYTLTIAMTAGEWFGANRNGDYFREADLKTYYQTFKNAGVFWNHDNKDMSKSSGKVLEVFYNEPMHRVELIIEIHKDKARYIPNYIKENKPIAVSMGMRVPTEICSICGHVTKGSYANRCQHLKFMMNKVLEDGQKVFAIAGHGSSLFDISYVFRPADKTAYVMMTKTK